MQYILYQLHVKTLAIHSLIITHNGTKLQRVTQKLITSNILCLKTHIIQQTLPKESQQFYICNTITLQDLNMNLLLQPNSDFKIKI